MYIIPMSFEIFSEQGKILQKIQMQMMDGGMSNAGGPPSSPPPMRPYWH